MYIYIYWLLVCLKICAGFNTRLWCGAETGTCPWHQSWRTVGCSGNVATGSHSHGWLRRVPCSSTHLWHTCPDDRGSDITPNMQGCHQRWIIVGGSHFWLHDLTNCLIIFGQSGKNGLQPTKDSWKPRIVPLFTMRIHNMSVWNSMLHTVCFSY